MFSSEVDTLGYYLGLWAMTKRFFRVLDVESTEGYLIFIHFFSALSSFLTSYKEISQYPCCIFQEGIIETANFLLVK